MSVTEKIHRFESNVYMEIPINFIQDIDIEIAQYTFLVVPDSKCQGW